jgi:hypothetical protein
LREKNNSMSPLQFAARREETRHFDLLIATDDSIKYCDRNAIVVPPMTLCDGSEGERIAIAKAQKQSEADRILVAQVTWINECIEQGTMICALLRRRNGEEEKSGRGCGRFYGVVGKV